MFVQFGEDKLAPDATTICTAAVTSPCSKASVSKALVRLASCDNESVNDLHTNVNSFAVAFAAF